MLSSQVKFSADRRTPVKQYAADLLMLGHKKVVKILSNTFDNQPHCHVISDKASFSIVEIA